MESFGNRPEQGNLFSIAAAACQLVRINGKKPPAPRRASLPGDRFIVSDLK